ncbi:MAG: MarR family transcriptional regulator, partial [Shimia sp.]|nr:MarR family transcriptional regulator [Shimia sp.]
KRQIDFTLLDNTFLEVADWPRAQQIANGWQIQRLHVKLDEFARTYCPIHRAFGVAYHWSVDQCEYATDIVFRRQAELAAIYGNLTRTAIHTVKPDNIATFLGRKLNVRYEGEMGNRFNIRIEGTRITESRII